MARQARIRCRLNHPNINPFLGYTEFPSVCLVSQWALNGSLQHVLDRCSITQPLPLWLGQRFVRDIAAGLAYLHSLRPALIHRTLSSRKVLIDGSLRGVITDFTLAGSIEETGPSFARMSQVRDPPRMTRPPLPWAAPELRAEQSYGLSCDVYSWGVVAKQVQDAVGANACVVNEELLASCLESNPVMRPSSDVLLAQCAESETPGEEELSGLTGRFGVTLHEALPGTETMEGWEIAPKFKLDYEELDYGDQVAEGGFSEIYSGTYKGRDVAIKKLKVWLLGETTLLEFQQEAEVLAALFHPNILVMVGITIFPALCIVTPWAERGSMERYVYNLDNELPPSLLCSIQLGVARGALYLHSLRILHRDIKCAVRR